MTEDFLMEKQTIYEMEYVFNLKDFIDFMMIQSNVNTKIENGTVTEREAREWFVNTLSSIFDDEIRTLIFSGYNWYIGKQ